MTHLWMYTHLTIFLFPSLLAHKKNFINEKWVVNEGIKVMCTQFIIEEITEQRLLWLTIFLLHIPPIFFSTLSYLYLLSTLISKIFLTRRRGWKKCHNVRSNQFFKTNCVNLKFSSIGLEIFRIVFVSFVAVISIFLIEYRQCVIIKFIFFCDRYKSQGTCWYSLTFAFN